MVSMLYLGDGKGQTGAVWAKNGRYGLLKSAICAKKTLELGF